MAEYHLDREIIRGRVFEDPADAREASERAAAIVGQMESEDLLIRWGWRLPVVAAAVLALTGVAIARSPTTVLVSTVAAFALNAVVVVLRKRQLSRAKSSLEGNRAVAQRAERSTPSGHDG